MSKTVSIIGAGVVGTAVGRLLRERGYAVKGVTARHIDKAGRAVNFIGAGEPGVDPAAAARGADWVLMAGSGIGGNTLPPNTGRHGRTHVDLPSDLR